jgi:glutamyl-tRNA synthetase
MADTSEARVRVRFAPSPTGYLHIGGLRTALYNYLFARQHRGQFLLRIEDTDQERFVPGSEDDILVSMRWAGLAYDEGLGVGGPHPPYRQSERKALGVYERYAWQLVNAGYAYVAFDTAEALEAARAADPTFRYDARTRLRMHNGETLSAGELEGLIASGQPYVIRLKVMPGETIRFTDQIRGEVAFNTSEVDDQVLVKSDGMPTYHLANVVDDHEMGITHVIRGEEWLPSTPKHLLLYRALGWRPPVFAHLPLILSPTGGKLSKRNAEQMGIPVSVVQYREAGYEPEALVNYLAFLGWNPGTEQELFTLDELVTAFRLDRVGAAGTRFDLDKLRWYNGQYLRRLSPEALAAKVRPSLEKHGFQPDDAYLHAVVELMRERLAMAGDLAADAAYFFVDPDTYDPKAVEKNWKPEAAALLADYALTLEALETFTAETTEAALRSLAEARGVGAGKLIHPARLAVSGVPTGPSLFHLMEVLGRDVCRRRIHRAVAVLGH